MAMLEDEDVRSFHFDDEFFAWREWGIDLKRLKHSRKFVTRFGSCSFDEPLEEFACLGLAVVAVYLSRRSTRRRMILAKIERKN